MFIKLNITISKYTINIHIHLNIKDGRKHCMRKKKAIDTHDCTLVTILVHVKNNSKIYKIQNQTLLQILLIV